MTFHFDWNDEIIAQFNSTYGSKVQMMKVPTTSLT
jgi:hypothetical protein